MSKLKLVIANKKYSSWSMRPWVFLKHHGIEFEEIRIPLYSHNYDLRIREYSPTGLVPALQDGELVVWESLAILEYLAEKYPQTQGWPNDIAVRARARAVSTEMHAGFSALRSTLTMNLKARYHWQSCDAKVMQDIARIEAIWEHCRTQYGKGGPWLFGKLTIADAMFAPVATRFRTYSVPLSACSAEYVETIYQWPAFKEWYNAGIAETETIPHYEFDHWKRC